MALHVLDGALECDARVVSGALKVLATKVGLEENANTTLIQPGKFAVSSPIYEIPIMLTYIVLKGNSREIHDLSSLQFLLNLITGLELNLVQIFPKYR